ncbi:MAG TPA: hypothetical protein VEI97_01350 [bacterium]|nr:hypothetical protein [bacterium]
MPLRPTDLPLGVSLIHAPSMAGARALLQRWRQDLQALPGSSPQLARLALVETLDAALATHPDPAIRHHHLQALLPPTPAVGAGPGDRIAALQARRAELLRSLERPSANGAGLAVAGTSAPPSAYALLHEDYLRWGQELEELQLSQASATQRLEHAAHQLRRIENEIQRDLHGIAAVPDASRQVTRLGEAQAEAKGAYLRLQDQRKELQTKRQGLAAKAKTRESERGRKLTLGAVFVLLGFASAFSPGVPAHLQPLGWAVVVLGVLLGLTGRSKKQDPKEVQLERQATELDRQVAEAEQDLREADKEVRTFCLSVGCTTPAQVIDLQRRYEATVAERDRLAAAVGDAEQALQALQDQRTAYQERLERWLAEVGAHSWEELGRRSEAARAFDGRSEGSPVAVLPAPPAAADMEAARGELAAIETELATLGAAGLTPLEQAVELGNRWIRAWGDGVQALELAQISVDDIRFRGPGGRAGSISELDSVGQVALYVLTRAALLETFAPSGLKLPLVLDDPLRFWDDGALPLALDLAQALAGPARRLALVTNRSHLVDSWRNQGSPLTVIELEDGSDGAAGT